MLGRYSSTIEHMGMDANKPMICPNWWLIWCPGTKNSWSVGDVPTHENSYCITMVEINTAMSSNWDTPQKSLVSPSKWSELEDFGFPQPKKRPYAPIFHVHWPCSAPWFQMNWCINPPNYRLVLYYFIPHHHPNITQQFTLLGLQALPVA